MTKMVRLVMVVKKVAEVVRVKLWRSRAPRPWWCRAKGRWVLMYFGVVMVRV